MKKKFGMSSPEAASEFQSNFVPIILGEREINFVQLMDKVLFSREINIKIQK
jgi:hypothetical protein